MNRSLLRPMGWVVPLIVAVTFVWTVSLGPAPITLDEPQRVAGTPIGLVPPPDFIPAVDFAGFQDHASGASVLVLIMPGPFPEIRKGFDNEQALKQRGMELLSSEERELDGIPGVFLRVDQKVQNTLYCKWIWVFGDDERSFFVMGTWPEYEDQLAEPLRDAVLSTRILEWSEDPFEGLGFSIDEAGEFVLAKRMGNDLVFTRSGAAWPAGDDEPFFVAAHSTQSVEVKDADSFARARLRQMAKHTGFKVERTESVEVDRLRGVELTARATTDSGKDVAAYQTILFEGSTYWIFQGVTPIGRRETDMASFGEMAHSLQRDRYTIASADGAVRVEASRGWSVTERGDEDQLEIGYPSADCYARVIPEAQVELARPFTLEEYAELVRSLMIGEDTFEVLSSEAVEVDDMPGLQVVFRMDVGELDLTYVHTTLGDDEYFYQLIAWTKTAAFELNKSYFDELIESFETDR